MKIGERVLTEREMEEKRIFEEQKRALEDRAARLRSMSMNVRANEGNNDHIEDIPAYVRKNMAIENPNASANNFYSDITVGRNNDGGPAGIQTANSFLNTRGID
jgi:cell division protein FtsZ